MPTTTTMSQMIESLAIELLDVVERGPGPNGDAQASTLLQAAIDFAWGRAGRAWADELAQALAESMPDIFSATVARCGPEADSLEVYAAVADALLTLEEETARVARSPR